MKLRNVFLSGCTVCSLLTACDSHPSFKTSTDAVESCQQELASLKKKESLSVEKLAKVTSYWLEMQDSAYSVFGRDSTINLKSPVAMAYFIVSDSIRGEINRLAFSNPRSLKDVMYLKIHSVCGMEKIHDSDAYKEALAFYEQLDEQPIYPNLSATMSKYTTLLGKGGHFKNGKELLSFISEEDRCFRSLMACLSQVSGADLQKITDATALIFDGLYSSVGYKTGSMDDRTMLYLTMRFNRRIVQNALACKADIDSGKRLDRTQRANYRWMLIQPFIAIDDYSTKVLTKEQKEELLSISDELPNLLGKLEIKRQTEEEKQEFTSVLSNYFLKTFLSTSL